MCNVYTCIYMYIYIHMYAYIRAAIWQLQVNYMCATYIHVNGARMHTPPHTNTHTQMHTDSHAQTQTRRHTRTHTQTCVCGCACARTLTRTHTDAHAHADAHTNVHVWVCVRARECLCACLCACVCVCVSVFVCIISGSTLLGYLTPSLCVTVTVAHPGLPPSHARTLRHAPVQASRAAPATVTHVISCELGEGPPSLGS